MADYSDLASLDATVPTTTNTVDESPAYQQETRGCLSGWYDALHTAVELTSPAGTLNLSTIGGTTVPHAGFLNVTTAGTTVTGFSNAIVGQDIYIYNSDAAQNLTLTASASLKIEDTSVTPNDCIHLKAISATVAVQVGKLSANVTS